MGLLAESDSRERHPASPLRKSQLPRYAKLPIIAQSPWGLNRSKSENAKTQKSGHRKFCSGMWPATTCRIWRIKTSRVRLIARRAGDCRSPPCKRCSRVPRRRWPNVCATRACGWGTGCSSWMTRVHFGANFQPPLPSRFLSLAGSLRMALTPLTAQEISASRLCNRWLPRNEPSMRNCT